MLYKFFVFLMIALVNLSFVWALYDGIRSKYVQAKKEFDESITGQVILFKEGNLDGNIRYNKEIS